MCVRQEEIFYFDLEKPSIEKKTHEFEISFTDPNPPDKN